MSLKPAFQTAAARCRAAREFNRLIGREQLMLYPRKIVLLRSFERCFEVGDPACHLGRMKGLHNHRFQKKLQRIGGMAVPKQDLDGQARGDFEQEHREIKRTLDMDGYLPDEVGHYIKRYADYRAGRGIMPAYYLDDLLQAWDSTVLPGFWTAAKARSFMAGEGDKLLAFWQNVNRLPDYSLLFPNDPDRGEPAKRQPSRGFGAMAPQGI